MSLQKRIAEHVAKSPTKVAIEHRDRKINYLELDKYSNRIANFLKEKCLSTDKIIFPYLDKSPELIGSILGILKFAGIFVPLDPQYSMNRLEGLIEEIRAEWIITRSEYVEKLAGIIEKVDRKINLLLLDSKVNDGVEMANLNIFYLEDYSSESYSFSEEILNPHCYIYFTSGSTGKPRGVLGRHRSLEHFIDWEIKEFGVDDQSRFSLLTSPSFDPFLREIFVPLCSGGTICIPENLHLQQVIRWIDEENISFMHMTPSYFKTLLDLVEDSAQFKNVRYILLAGEMLRGRDIKKFYQLFEERIGLINLYGPTETTLAKLFYRVKKEDVERDKIPVGKPISVTEAIILDQFKQPCEIGTVGEVYIRTPFVSSGYYNQPEETGKVFLQNPFNDNPKDIIYKTGDLGKKLPDGNIVLMGRVDHQVKIRGMRIEPGEIEIKLLSHPDVKDVIVLAKENSELEKILLAFVITGGQVTEEEIKGFLAGKLPAYMIPAHIISIEKMPLTNNGKIDRKSLLEMDIQQNRRCEYIAPENEIEEKLVRIWTELFPNERIGVMDNFVELGGHSLNAISLIAKIYKEFNIELGVREIFLNLNIKSQANVIELSIKYGATEESPMMLLNKRVEKNIFAFPAIFGYGLTYSSLAQLIQSHSFYSFNFIDEGDAVEKYVELITQTQPEGPYTLFGYSAGGGLAFDVACRLGEKGYVVNDLIMVDSKRSVEVASATDEEYEERVDKLLDEIEEPTIKELLKVDSIKKKVRRKISEYLKYKTQILNTGVLTGNIHFISSEVGERVEQWQGATTGSFYKYQGQGDHLGLFGEENLVYNVRIICDILGKI